MSRRSPWWPGPRRPAGDSGPAGPPRPLAIELRPARTLLASAGQRAGLRSRPVQPVGDSPERGLRAVGGADLPVDMGEVRANRRLSDRQAPGDRARRKAGGQEEEHFALALGEAAC